MNKILLKGRISNEFNLKELDNNKRVVNFNIAVRRNFRNKENQYDSDFFNCSAFDNIADLISKYFIKGQEILIIGHLQNNQWETDSGEKRTATNVIVESVEFCGSKQQNNTNNDLSEFAENSGVNVNVIGDDEPLPF